MTRGDAPPPTVLHGADRLRVVLNDNGSLRRIDQGALLLNLFPGLEIEGGPANLWLRRGVDSADAEAVPLLGPSSPLPPLRAGAGTPRIAATGGRVGDLHARLQLRLSAACTAWFWHLELRNDGPLAITLDAVHAQDVGLCPYAAARLNEYYVSHYLDFQPLRHAELGTLLAVRQNRAVDGRFPWLLFGATEGGAVSYATDARQLHGHALRAGEASPGLRGGLPGRRLQHEHAMAALQSAPRTLAPGESARFGFFAMFVADHPEASTPADLAWAEQARHLPEAAMAAPDGPEARDDARGARSLFVTAPWFAARELLPAEVDRLFGTARRHEERDGARLLSFFRGEHGHVVLRAKEREVMRPHGMILRSGTQLEPDEASLTSTAWMAGVFHSMLTQGHVGINRFLSTVRSTLSLFRSQGQRIFVGRGGAWRQLGLPSAFEMTPFACRWWYRDDETLIEVESRAGEDAHVLELRLQVHEGPALDWRVTHDVCLGGDDGSESVPPRWAIDGGARVTVAVPPIGALAQRFPDGRFVIDAVRPPRFARVGGDELLWSDGVARGQPFVCVGGDAAREFALRVAGALVGDARPRGDALALPRWRDVDGALGPLAEALPWMLRDALVHYLSPRGLEQFSGGGWGTRDVCQGPLEMLLALGRADLARGLLVTVFAAQDPAGDWPQWFMFFARERELRAGDSHGDIVLWPVLAAARYLLASGDAGWLDLAVPFHAAPGAPAESAPLREHLHRALAVAASRRIAGTALVAYGHGDWNDSLQPADPALREHLCSAWTVTLHHQALASLARAMRGLGEGAEAGRLQAQADRIAGDFRRVLVVDDQVAGYALFPPGGEVEWLLHPRDRRTGLRASLLPMMHAVLADLLSPEQAEAQRQRIARTLTGPDGARLFDAPLAYRGGVETLFQRAESSAYFGREIGVMYMHAHLRYAEMLAHLGRGTDLLRALSLAHAVGLPERLHAATRRQANCYYSSSDAAFADRYEASARYGEIAGGGVPLDGGWRVYSSGPGLLIACFVERLLGLRREHDRWLFDPVLTPELDGLHVEWPIAGTTLQVSYRVGPRGHGPVTIRLGAVELAFEREPNRYRTGAAAVAAPVFADALATGARQLVIVVG